MRYGRISVPPLAMAEVMSRVCMGVVWVRPWPMAVCSVSHWSAPESITKELWLYGRDRGSFRL